MSSKYVVEQVDVRLHAQAISALWARCLRSLTPQAAMGRLQHRYLANPAGSGATLLLKQADPAELAGVQCLHDRRFHQGARQWRVAGFADYAVAEAHRSLGPALQLMKKGIALAQAQYDWVYGLTNDKSEAVCKRSGLQRFGGVVRWTHALRSGQLLRRRLPGWLARAVAPLVDTALLLRDAARLGGAQRLQWQDTHRADPALDTVWQQRSSPLLMSERSRAVLEWRFAVEVPGRWTVSVARRADGTPLGYVVWRVEDRMALIADFFCADPVRDTATLLRGFAWHQRAQPVERLSLEFFGSPDVAAGVRAAGFVPRPEHLPLYLAAGAAAAVPPPEHWYFTSFDRDGE
jgi:hypothetical protein